MKWSAKLFTVKGITLRLHITLLALVAWLLMLYGANGIHGARLLWSVLFLAAVLASIALHEFGHALVASLSGVRTKDITLFPLGGIASIERLPKNPKQELLISAAGPAVSLLLAALCWWLFPGESIFNAYGKVAGRIDQKNFLACLGVANLLLALFNLIPAFPLDGGRMLRAVFAFRHNDLKATHIVATISKVVAASFAVYGLITLNVLLSLLGFFILAFAQAEDSYLQLKALVRGMPLKDMLTYDHYSLDADVTVHEAANIIRQYHNKVFLLMDNGQVIGTINRLDVMKALAEQQYDTKLASLANYKFEAFDGETTADKVLEKLSANEEKLYPVMEKGRFAGVVNFHHLIEYLLLHKVNTEDFAKTKSLVELV